MNNESKLLEFVKRWMNTWNKEDFEMGSIAEFVEEADNLIKATSTASALPRSTATAQYHCQCPCHWVVVFDIPDICARCGSKVVQTT
jgi:hypothetical protein